MSKIYAFVCERCDNVVSPDEETHTTFMELREKELPDTCGMEPPSGWALEPVLYGLTRLVEHLITVSIKSQDGVNE